MINPSYYIPMLAFTWGLAGGFSHCIGMCGIFVASYTAPLPQTAPEAEKAHWHPERHLMFHGGRMFSLVLLGAIAGVVGDIGHRWPIVQGLISILAGVGIFLLSLGFSGIMPQFQIPEPDVLGAGGGILRRLFARALQSRIVLKPFLIGVFVGLLPCGLTYQALIPAAASGSEWMAMSTMALFCLGTIPGLLLLGVFGGKILGGLLMRETFRTRMTTVAAVIMAIMGAVFVVRGLVEL